MLSNLQSILNSTPARDKNAERYWCGYLKACKLLGDDKLYYTTHPQRFFNGIGDYVNYEAKLLFNDVYTYSHPKTGMKENLEALADEYDERYTPYLIVCDLARLGFINIEFLNGKLYISSVDKLFEIVTEVAETMRNFK